MNYRYERKYYIPHGMVSSVEVLLKRHPAGFNTHYASRQINNIYFDTSVLDSYVANLESVPLRLKVRLRWYGEPGDKIDKSQLEVKVKDGYLNRKLNFQVGPWSLEEKISLLGLIDGSALKECPMLLRHRLIPTVANSYKRHYFLTGDGSIRATVDEQIQALPISQDKVSRQKSSRILGGVLEFKYNREEDKTVNQIIDRFPYRLSSCSKYALALEQVSGLGR